MRKCAERLMSGIVHTHKDWGYRLRYRAMRLKCRRRYASDPDERSKAIRLLKLECFKRHKLADLRAGLGLALFEIRQQLGLDCTTRSTKYWRAMVSGSLPIPDYDGMNPWQEIAYRQWEDAR